MGSDEDSDNEDEASGNDESGSGSDAESEDEDNMSSSQSESEDEDQVLANEDEGLTQEELRLKYAAIPSVHKDEIHEPQQLDQGSMDANGGGSSPAPDQTSPNSPASATVPGSQLSLPLDDQCVPAVPLEEVDDALMDDSDASTNMDSEMDDSDGASSEEVEDDEESEDEEESTGLLGFFGNKAKQEFRAKDEEGDEETKGTGEAHDENLEGETEEVSSFQILHKVQRPLPHLRPQARSLIRKSLKD